MPIFPKHFLSALFVCCALSGALSGKAKDVRQQDGFDVYSLANDYWLVEIVPALGGKLVSLRDLVADREWLWSRDEKRSLHRIDMQAGFGAGNLIGADELLPNLQIERWNGMSLPGHGEVWSSELSIDAEAWANGQVTTSLSLQSLPLQYQRVVSLNGRTLYLDYTIKNTGTEAIPYLWAWHPLFAIETGDQLHINSDGDMLVKAAPGLTQLSAGDVFSWPGNDVSIDLSHLCLGDLPKAGLKVYTCSPKDGVVLLANKEMGAQLAIRYNPDALPSLAFWISRGVWDGAHHVAIEPTNQSDEILDRSSADTNDLGWLWPGEVRSWRLSLVNESQSL